VASRDRIVSAPLRSSSPSVTDICRGDPDVAEGRGNPAPTAAYSPRSRSVTRASSSAPSGPPPARYRDGVRTVSPSRRSIRGTERAAGVVEEPSSPRHWLRSCGTSAGSATPVRSIIRTVAGWLPSRRSTHTCIDSAACSTPGTESDGPSPLGKATTARRTPDRTSAARTGRPLGRVAVNGDTATTACPCSRSIATACWTQASSPSAGSGVPKRHRGSVASSAAGHRFAVLGTTHTTASTRPRPSGSRALRRESLFRIEYGGFKG
jgi:hypothetical protein